MLSAKRISLAAPLPPLSPISPSAIPRPHSSASQRHTRMSSDAVSLRGSPEPDVRNVRVVLRIRPNDPDDTSVPPRFRSTLVHPTAPSEVRVDVDPATLAGHGASGLASGSKRHPTFSFDTVLGEGSSQVDLYDATAKETVDEFLKGHNITFLAYGQTSSGKSYSMGTTGEDADYAGTEFHPRTGLIPRTVRTIFERAEELRIASGPGATWECRLSFLELYNEEIIDLLSGTGVSISIREERDGRIIWAGVREVKVKTLGDVMQYLYEGSARRKTGETGMNATSSRSHAIFSLTLVQKRRAGLPVSASQPIASEVSTPTRLKRPSSMIGMAHSRSPTPSGSKQTLPPSSFVKGVASGLSRPNSYVGPSSSDGEYVVVTSKFNMVDLAGSERLKRTAAQGDRMKEGISINSGLLALGNVISTLADPIKAKGHIPYRDSKLTRMLQDSIGGNALTTMIACVSPIEYNINETVNTIKYAARARNIRNVAKINAIEAGWDDVEHLQALVTKLRKQLSTLDTTKGGAKSTDGNDQSSEKLLQRLAELQREHTELYDRYLGKCSDNMRMTSELRNAKPGDADSLAKFNETVEPVILEYEKVVAALNKQLDDLRAELTMITDMYEEQGGQLAQMLDRQSQSDSYVNELRTRVAKLTERNTSSESYIADLETKLKAHTDQSDGQGEAVIELKKEIAKLKEANVRLNEHTVEIEVRLSKSEEGSTSLLAQIERHEREALQREAAYKELEKHVDLLDTSKDNKLLLEEIASKEARIVELENEVESSTAGQQDREHLQTSIASERAVRAELQAKVTELEASVSSRREGSVVPATATEGKDIPPSRSPVGTFSELTPPESPGGAPPISPDVQVEELKAALEILSARFAEAESKYTEAETQIATLTTQLSEAKLIHAEMDDVLPLASPGTSDDVSENGSPTLQTPKGSSPDSSPQQPVSKRGSMPMLSTLSSNGSLGGKGRDFRVGRGHGESKRVRPQSLSQELSSAQSLGSSPRASWIGSNTLRLATSPSRQSLPVFQRPLRSSQSLEAELKFVHDVVDKRDEELKDREAYIRQLEELLQQTTSSHLIPSRKPSANPTHTTSGLSPDGPLTIPLPPSPAIGPVEIKVEDEHGASGLSPSSTQRFNDLKDSLNRGGPVDQADVDEQARVATLLREMAVKESSQRAIIEQQFVQIADLQKINHKLKEELSDQESPLGSDKSLPVTPMKRTAHSRGPSPSPTSLGSPSAAINHLREEHAEELQAILKSNAESMAILERDLQTALQEARSAMDKARIAHDDQTEATQREHAQALSDLVVSHETATTDLQHIHDALVDDLRTTHQQELDQLKKAHTDEMDALSHESELLVEEMEKSISASEEERRQLKMKADQAAFDLSRKNDEYQIQASQLRKQLVELRASNDTLEKAKVNLESANANLSKRLSDLDVRKKTPTVPPQGPPPNTPLPPLPGQMSSPLIKDLSSDGTMSSSTHQSASTPPTSTTHTEVAAMPEHVGLTVQKVMAERDAALAAKRELEQTLEQTKEAADQAMEEKVRADNLVRDLHDARKTNSKLRAHLEDARQESKRLSEACKEHTEELNNRRNTMSTLSRESGQQRDSLLAATAQVQALRAQLDRAVEQKVNKKLNSRLKCF